MANTTNYNWETPDDTDLVKDGAAAIRTLGSSIDTTTKNLNPETTLGDIAYRSATANTNTRLAIGTTGQVLTVAGGVPTWATSDDANAIQNAIVDAKGDIVAASAADTPARLAVGTDNQRLVAASGETTGLKYVSDTQNTVIDAEGDLLVGDAADALQRLAIGSNAQVLTVDTSVDGKIKWATPAGGGGKVLQVVQDTDQTGFSTTSATYVDTTMSVSITPSSATSKVLIIVSLPAYTRAGGGGTSAWGAFNIVRTSTQITQFNYGNAIVSNNHEHITPYTIVYLDSPATTSATTYKVQAKKGGGQDINYEGANFNASITCMEIGA